MFNNRINIKQLIYDIFEYILLKTTTSLIDFSQTITSLCVTLQFEVTFTCKQTITPKFEFICLVCPFFPNSSSLHKILLAFHYHHHHG